MSYMNHHQDDRFDHEVDYKFDDSDLQSTDTLWEDLNLGPTLSVSSTGSLSKERGLDPAYDSDLDLLKKQQQQNFEAQQQQREAPPPEKKGNIRMIPEEDRVYLHGLKLFLVMASLTAVSFLIVLDSSIIVTVSPYSRLSIKFAHFLIWYRLFPRSKVTLIRFKTLVGMVAHIRFRVPVCSP